MVYFESIDAESLFGAVLSIRQKRAKGKKLEKYEREFLQNNRALISLETAESGKPKTAEEKLREMFSSLSEGGD